MSLAVCSSCSRHVRESVCPFCGAAVVAPVAVSGMRLPRIALVTAAAAAVAASACASAAYGGPPIDASTNDAAQQNDAGQDATATFYGGPPIDSGFGD